jgi:hypothetical protein
MDTERSLYCQREKYIVFREGNIVPCNGPYTTYPNKLFFVRWLDLVMGHTYLPREWRIPGSVNVKDTMQQPLM